MSSTVMVSSSESIGDYSETRNWIAAELDVHLLPHLEPLAQGLPRVRRDADRLGLLLDRAADRLLDPVRGVGGEAVALRRLELVDGVHQAEVALFHEVHEIDALAVVLLGDRHHEPEVGLHDAGLARLVALLGLLPELVHLLARDERELLDALEVLADCVGGRFHRYPLRISNPFPPRGATGTANMYLTIAEGFPVCSRRS
jgi:hypothetical protein